jgi:hypothetical protein
VFLAPAASAAAAGASPASLSALDVTRSSAYSLEDGRQRSAADARSRDAEVVKGRRRQAVAALRQAFASFRSRLAAASAAEEAASPVPAAAAAAAAATPGAGGAAAAPLLLSEAELALDPLLLASLHEQGAARLAEADKAWAYAVARRRLQLRKLVRAFLGSLAVGERAVAGLDPSRRVSAASIPTPHLHPSVLAAAAELVRLAALLNQQHGAAATGSRGGSGSGSSEQPSGAATPVPSGVPAAPGAAGVARIAGASAGGPAASLLRPGAPPAGAAAAALGPGGVDPSSPQAVRGAMFALPSALGGEGAAGESKGGAEAADAAAAAAGAGGSDEEGEGGPLGSTALFVQRRALRLARKAALEALAAQRPGPGDDYPPDAAAVAWAGEHMGQHRLKGASDYRPPKGVRVDAWTKRAQLLELELSAAASRMQYNAALAALAARRPVVIAALLSAQAEVACIEAELSRGGVANLLAAAGAAPPPLPAPEAGSAAVYPQSVFTFELPPLPWLLQGLREGAAAGTAAAAATSADGTPPLDLTSLVQEVLGSDAAAGAPAADATSVATAAAAGDAGAVTAGSTAAVAAVPAPAAAGAAPSAPAPAASRLPLSLLLSCDPQAQLLAGLANGLTPSLLRAEARCAGDLTSLAAHHSAGTAAAGAGIASAAAAASAVRLFPWLAAAAGGSPSASAHGVAGAALPADRWSFDALAAARDVCAGQHLQGRDAAAAGAAPSPAVPVGPLSGPPSAEEVADARALYSLLFDRGLTLKRSQQALLQSFDAAVAALSRERLRLAVTAVAGPAVRRRVLAAELSLLHDMSVRDAALEGRAAKASADKAAVSAALASHAGLLAERRAELDGLQARERALQGELEEAVAGGVGHPAYAALLRIYKRKVKRAKPAAAGGEGKGEDGDGSDSDSDDDVDIGDEDDEDEEEETAPDGVDRATFERVLALRERRLEVEEAAADINKQTDELRKAADRYSSREKTIDRELGAISGELSAFQREKQSRLNAIPSVVMLRASQLVAGLQPAQFAAAAGAGGAETGGASTAPFPEGAPLGQLPASAEHCVVFGRRGLRSLRSRVGELEGEAAALRVRYAELHGDERRLQAEKRRLEGLIAASRARAEELQQLKFGRVIDVAALDRATAAQSSAAEAVQGELGVATAAQDGEVEALRREMARHQAELLSLTRTHTVLLEETAFLVGRQAALEATLSGRTEAAADATALSLALGATSAPGALAATMAAMAAAGGKALRKHASGGGSAAVRANRPSGSLLRGGEGGDGGLLSEQPSLANSVHSASQASTVSAATLVGAGPGRVGPTTSTATASTALSAHAAGRVAAAASAIPIAPISGTDLTRTLTAIVGAGASRVGKGKGARGGGAATAPSATASAALLGGNPLTAALGGHSGVVITDASSLLEADSEERQGLLAAIRSQAEEIAALRAEIGAMRRKGGLTQLPPPPAAAPPGLPPALATLTGVVGGVGGVSSTHSAASLLPPAHPGQLHGHGAGAGGYGPRRAVSPTPSIGAAVPPEQYFGASAAAAGGGRGAAAPAAAHPGIAASSRASTAGFGAQALIGQGMGPAGAGSAAGRAVGSPAAGAWGTGSAGPGSPPATGHRGQQHRGASPRAPGAGSHSPSISPSLSPSGGGGARARSLSPVPAGGIAMPSAGLRGPAEHAFSEGFPGGGAGADAGFGGGSVEGSAAEAAAAAAEVADLAVGSLTVSQLHTRGGGASPRADGGHSGSGVTAAPSPLGGQHPPPAGHVGFLAKPHSGAGLRPRPAGTGAAPGAAGPVAGQAAMEGVSLAGSNPNSAGLPGR